MPRVTPEPPVHHGARVRRVGLEAGELPVAAGLEREADDPEPDPRVVQESEWRRAVDRAEQRQRDHGGEQRLEPEDEVEALQCEARLVARADRLVAAVLGLAVIAPRQVRRETQSPDRGQHGDEQSAWSRCRGDDGVCDRGQHEQHAPERVDDGDVALRDAHDPSGRGGTEEHDESSEPGGEVEHQASLDDSTSRSKSSSMFPPDSTTATVRPLTSR